MIQTERPRLARLTGRLTSVRLPSVRRAALWAAQAACLTAASGAAMLGGLSPFSAALCAAGLARGWSVIASDLRGADFYSRPDPGERYVLVIGSEAHGISDATRAAADMLVKLPMRGGAESLNAAVAAGIMMYALMGT